MPDLPGFGHTKVYRKLPAVCAICGDLHNTAACTKSKEGKEVPILAMTTMNYIVLTTEVVQFT